MKKLFLLPFIAMFLFACSSGSKDGKLDLPKDFNSRSDIEKVSFLMEAVSPDSVAILICRASLGELENLKIDTFANATLYAYEQYKGDDLDTFSNTIEGYKESLPLAKKMQIYKLAGEEDPMGLGYALGLEYVGQIRLKNMTVKEIREELAYFKKACAGDPETYRRFIIGFKTALKADKGQGIASDVYSSFVNMSEN